MKRIYVIQQMEVYKVESEEMLSASASARISSGSTSTMGAKDSEFDFEDD